MDLFSMVQLPVSKKEEKEKKITLEKWGKNAKMRANEMKP